VCAGGYNKLRNDPDSSDSPASSPGQNSDADDSDANDSWPADRHQPISTVPNAAATINSFVHTDFTTPKAVVTGGREPKSASSTDGESTLTKRSQERLTAPARFVRRALVKSYQQFMGEDAPSDDVSHAGILPLAAEETSLGLSLAAADRRDGGSEDSREASSEGEDEANDNDKTAFDYQSLYDDDNNDSGALVAKHAGGEQQPRRLAERVKQQFEALSGGKLKSYQQDVPSRAAQMERQAALEALLGGEEMPAPGDGNVGEASSHSTVTGEGKSAFSAIGNNFRRAGDDHLHDNSNNRDDVFSLAPFAAAKYSKLSSSKSSAAGSECHDTQQALLSSPESVEAIFANAPFAKLTLMAPALATTDSRKQDVFATYMNPLAVAADQADIAAREQSTAASSTAKHHAIDSEDQAQKLRSADNHGPSQFVVDWPATTSLTSINSSVPTKLVTMKAAPAANNMPNNAPVDVQVGSGGGGGLVVWGDGVFTAAPALNTASANSVTKMVNVMYSNPATSFSTSGGVQHGPSVPPVHTADHVTSSNPSVSQQHQNVGVTVHRNSKVTPVAPSATGVQRSGNHQSLFTEDPNSPEGVRMSDDILVDADEPLLAKDKGSSSSVGLSKKLRQSPLDSSSSSASSMRLPSAVSPFGGGVTGPSPRGFIGRLTGGGGSGKVGGTVSPTAADDQSGGNSSSASSLSSPYGSLKRGKDKGVLGSGKKSQSVVDSQFANAGFMDDLALEREENFDSNALGNSYPLATRQGQATASMNIVTKDRSNSLPRSAKYTK
jgi:hypothetical protein